MSNARLNARDRTYFSGRIRKLAQAFNKTVAAWKKSEDIPDVARKMDRKARGIFGCAQELRREFLQDGHCRGQWQKLLQNCGAASKVSHFGIFAAPAAGRKAPPAKC